MWQRSAGVADGASGPKLLSGNLRLMFSTTGDKEVLGDSERKGGEKRQREHGFLNRKCTSDRTATTEWSS